MDLSDLVTTNVTMTKLTLKRRALDMKRKHLLTRLLYFNCHAQVLVLVRDLSFRVSVEMVPFNSEICGNWLAMHG